LNKTILKRKLVRVGGLGNCKHRFVENRLFFLKNEVFELFGVVDFTGCLIDVLVMLTAC
jgi:hypothetical protein